MRWLRFSCANPIYFMLYFLHQCIVIQCVGDTHQLHIIRSVINEIHAAHTNTITKGREIFDAIIITIIHTLRLLTTTFTLFCSIHRPRLQCFVIAIPKRKLMTKMRIKLGIGMIQSLSIDTVWTFKPSLKQDTNRMLNRIDIAIDLNGLLSATKQWFTIHIEIDTAQRLNARSHRTRGILQIRFLHQHKHAISAHMRRQLCMQTINTQLNGGDNTLTSAFHTNNAQRVQSIFTFRCVLDPYTRLTLRAYPFNTCAFIANNRAYAFRIDCESNELTILWLCSNETIIVFLFLIHGSGTDIGTKCVRNIITLDINATVNECLIHIAQFRRIEIATNEDTHLTPIPVNIRIKFKRFLLHFGTVELRTEKFKFGNHTLTCIQSCSPFRWMSRQMNVYHKK
mmetsp:Transcript_52190/g.86359  ORF Transcript_52190/g.86359 Transcript_52190/m.86359 type:complete len:396 (+) Transcript_52190:354-1541(+)